MQLSLRKDLTALKAAALSALETRVSDLRSQYVTQGADALYAAKVSESDAILADNSIDVSTLTYLPAEAAAFGRSLVEQAQIVRDRAAACRQPLGDLEARRQKARAQIAAATSPAEIAAVTLA